jgi:hypothetical protein
LIRLSDRDQAVGAGRHWTTLPAAICWNAMSFASADTEPTAGIKAQLAL